MLKDLPRFECLIEAAAQYPSLEPAACEAFLNLLRTGDLVFDAEGRFLSRHGISQGRFTVLSLLHHCSENRTPAGLADEAGVTRATMTGLLDTLEKDGLIRRDMDPNDRRTVLVSLTEKGDTLMKNTLPPYFSCVSQIMQPLSETEQRLLVDLLQKIQQGLTDRPLLNIPSSAVVAG